MAFCTTVLYLVCICLCVFFFVFSCWGFVLQFAIGSPICAGYTRQKGVTARAFFMSGLLVVRFDPPGGVFNFRKIRLVKFFPKRREKWRRGSVLKRGIVLVSVLRSIIIRFLFTLFLISLLLYNMSVLFRRSLPSWLGLAWLGLRFLDWLGPCRSWRGKARYRRGAGGA